MSLGVQRLVEERRHALTERLEGIEAQQARGEESSRPLELSLLVDEFAFLVDVMRLLVDEAEAAQFAA